MDFLRSYLERLWSSDMWITRITWGMLAVLVLFIGALAIQSAAG